MEKLCYLPTHLGLISSCPGNEKNVRFPHICPPGGGRTGGFGHFYHLFIVLPIQILFFTPRRGGNRPLRLPPPGYAPEY